MTDNIKQPPSTKEEVSDVLSSIRRLVSDELREKGEPTGTSTLGMLSLDNDVRADKSDSTPLVLSDRAQGETVPEKPVVVPPAKPTKIIDTQPLDLAETSEVANDPPLTAKPISGSSKLPRPIGPIADTKDTPDKPKTVLPLSDKGLSNPSEKDATSTSAKDQSISPFALASLEKRQAEKREAEVEASGSAVEVDLSGSQTKPEFVNPFARKRAREEGGNAGDVSETTKAAPTKTNTPKELVAEVEQKTEIEEVANPAVGNNQEFDPEFESFQNAEKAFEELAEAAEALKLQSTFEGVQNVIEEASIRVQSKQKPAEDKKPTSEVLALRRGDVAKQELASESPAEQASSPAETPEPAVAAPFFDEAELRAIVTDIVRDELSSELGEKLSRNIRKIIRRQVDLALSEDKGKSGIRND